MNLPVIESRLSVFQFVAQSLCPLHCPGCTCLAPGLHTNIKTSLPSSQIIQYVCIRTYSSCGRNNRCWVRKSYETRACTAWTTCEVA